MMAMVVLVLLLQGRSRRTLDDPCKIGSVQLALTLTSPPMLENTTPLDAGNLSVGVPCALLFQTVRAVDRRSPLGGGGFAGGNETVISTDQNSKRRAVVNILLPLAVVRQ